MSVICKYYVRGYCGHGDQCRYLHPIAGESKSRHGSLSSYMGEKSSQDLRQHPFYDDDQSRFYGGKDEFFVDETRFYDDREEGYGERPPSLFDTRFGGNRQMNEERFSGGVYNPVSPMFADQGQGYGNVGYYHLPPGPAPMRQPHQLTQQRPRFVTPPRYHGHYNPTQFHWIAPHLRKPPQPPRLSEINTDGYYQSRMGGDDRHNLSSPGIPLGYGDRSYEEYNDGDGDNNYRYGDYERSFGPNYRPVENRSPLLVTTSTSPKVTRKIGFEEAEAKPVWDNASGRSFSKSSSRRDSGDMSVSGYSAMGVHSPSVETETSGRKKGEHTPGEYVQIIVQDMKEWKISKQWLFSCYAFAKDMPCAFGFPDVSPEEMRVDAYAAMQTGQMNAYVQNVNNLSEQFQTLWTKFVNASSEDKQQLKEYVTNFMTQHGSAESEKYKGCWYWFSAVDEQFISQSSSCVSQALLASLTEQNISKMVNEAPPNFSFRVNTPEKKREKEVSPGPKNFTFGTTDLNSEKKVLKPNFEKNLVAGSIPAKGGRNSSPPVKFSFNVAGNKPVSETKTGLEVAVWNKLEPGICEFTSGELDAFQARSFRLGKIPNKPPPREIC